MEEKIYLIVLAMRFTSLVAQSYSRCPPSAISMNADSFGPLPHDCSVVMPNNQYSYNMFDAQGPIMYPQNMPTLPTHPNPPVPHLQPAPNFPDPLPSVDSPDRPQVPPGMPLIVIPIYSSIPSNNRAADLPFIGKRRFRRHRNDKPFPKKFRRYHNDEPQVEKEETGFADNKSPRMSGRRYPDDEAQKDRDDYHFADERSNYMSQQRFRPDREQRDRDDNDFSDDRNFQMRSYHADVPQRDRRDGNNFGYRNNEAQKNRDDNFAEIKIRPERVVPSQKTWGEAGDVKVRVKTEEKYDGINWIPNGIELTVRREQRKEQERPQVPKIQYIDSDGKVLYEKKITEIDEKTINELKNKQFADRDKLKNEIISIYSSGEAKVKQGEPKFNPKRRIYKNGNLVFQ